VAIYQLITGHPHPEEDSVSGKTPMYLKVGGNAVFLSPIETR